MTELPTSMRSLVAPKFCTPSGYEVYDMPLPTIKKPNDVLIRVYAGAIQAGDTQRANGVTRILPGKIEFPMKIGIEGVSNHCSSSDLTSRSHGVKQSAYIVRSSSSCRHSRHKIQARRRSIRRLPCRGTTNRPLRRKQLRITVRRDHRVPRLAQARQPIL